MMILNHHHFHCNTFINSSSQNACGEMMSPRVSHLRKATGFIMPRRCTVSQHTTYTEETHNQLFQQARETTRTKQVWLYTCVVRCSMGTVRALQGGVRHAIMWQLYFFISMNTIEPHISKSSLLHVHLFRASGRNQQKKRLEHSQSPSSTLKNHK